MTTPNSQSEIKRAKKELEDLLASRYRITKYLGTGGAGIVFEIGDKASGIVRVAKLLREEVRDIPKIKEDFENEISKLARLRHHNLVTVYERSVPGVAPYLIMELVKGKHIDDAVALLARKNSGGKWVHEFRSIVVQLTDAIAYLHSQKPPLLHLDIKPENIIVTDNYRGKSVPILLDFGIARFSDEKHQGATQVRGTFPMWPTKYYGSLRRMTHAGRAVFIIQRNLINTNLDLHLLGRTVALCLEKGVQADKEPMSTWDDVNAADFRFLQGVVSRLDIDEAEEAIRFETAADLRRCLRRLEMRAGRASYGLDDAVVKIPGRAVSRFGRQVRRLTDWDKFQRLRGIKQLGFAYLVYPGAVHSRFEHALGVYQNAVDILDHVAGPKGDFRFRSVVTDEELVGCALVALLHDIGHYPFAHQFRLRGEFPKHEERSLHLIESAQGAERITSAFNKDVYSATVQIMKAVIAHDFPRRRTTAEFPKHFKVLRSVVSGTVDVDKIDYVFRDAHHAGVPYGKIVDFERLKASLRVWWSKGGEPELTISDKGRVCAEALVFARYLMTSEVYWNHAVRAYAAMLSAAIEVIDSSEVKKHFWDTDDELLTWLRSFKKTSWLPQLIAERRPYRRAFVHQQIGGPDHSAEADKTLFKLLERAVSERPERGIVKSIKDVVASSLDLGDYAEHEIVIDVPEGLARVGGIRVLPEGHQEPGTAGPIFNAIGDNFDGFVRKARIFVHPRLMLNRQVPESTAVVRKALMSEFQIA